MDREMALRAAAEALPAPPPMREGQRPLSVATVRLPAGAVPPAPVAEPAPKAKRAPAKPRVARQPVAAKES
jgi:hypothetical protein